MDITELTNEEREVIERAGYIDPGIIAGFLPEEAHSLIKGYSDSRQLTLELPLDSVERGRVVIALYHSFRNQWRVENVVSLKQVYEALAAFDSRVKIAEVTLESSYDQNALRMLLCAVTITDLSHFYERSDAKNTIDLSKSREEEEAG